MTDLPIDYGPVDPNVEEPRYTTVEDVKARLQIPVADTSFDDRLLVSIVAAEYAIDVELGRSVPDGPGVPDESEPGPVTIVPAAWVVAATDTAVAVYKSGDAPMGTGGSDEFFGALDVTDIARTIITRSPILRGFKVSAGFGVA